MIRRGHWVDRASVGIPYLYISTAATLAEAEAQQGDSADANKRLMVAQQVAKATGLDELLNLQPLAPRQVAAPGDQPAVQLLDTSAVPATKPSAAPPAKPVTKRPAAAKPAAGSRPAP